MKNLLADNLHMLMSEQRLSSSELSRRIDLPAVTIKKLRTGENQNPTITTLIPIAAHFGITISQLIGEVPLHSKDIAKKDVKGAKGDERVQAFPLLKWSEISPVPPMRKIVNRYYLVTESKVSKKSFSLVVEDADNTNFKQGDVILVDPEASIGHNDFVIVQKVDQSIPSLKRVIKDDNNYYLQSLLKDISTITPLDDTHTIIGPVVAYKKWLKHS